MLVRSRWSRRRNAVSMIVAMTAVAGLVACVPVGFRVSSSGVSLSSLGFFMSPTGLNFGGSQNSTVPVQDPGVGPRQVAATFHNEFACQDRIGLGQGAGFIDQETGACFACPDGFVRASGPIDAPLACRQQGLVGFFEAAESLGVQGCGPETFQIGDACYSCPADATPSGGNDVGTACLTNS